MVFPIKTVFAIGLAVVFIFAVLPYAQENVDIPFIDDVLDDGTGSNDDAGADVPLVVDEPAWYYKVTETGVYCCQNTLMNSGTDQENIEWAMSHCKDGYRVYIAPGTYEITKKLFVYHHLAGAGAGQTKLVASGITGSTMVQISTTAGGAVSNVTMTNMELDGKKASYSSSTYGAILLVKASKCTLENLYVHDFPKSHGIEFQGSSNNLIKNCEVSGIGQPDVPGMYGNGICAGSMLKGIDSANNVVDGCTVTDCSMVGVNWEPGRDNTVKNCVIKGMTHWMNGNTYMYSRAVTCFEVSGWSPSSGNKFINCDIQNDGIVVAYNSADSVWEDCTIITTGVTAEKVKCALQINGAANGKGATFKNCEVSFMSTADVAGQGIKLYQADNNVVTNCIFYEKGVAGKGHGVWVSGNGNTITGCVSHDCAACVSNSGSGNTISGNT